MDKTLLLGYNLAGRVQSVLTQEVFVQRNAGFYKEQGVFQWYGERGDDYDGKSYDKKLCEANKLQEDFLSEFAAEA